MLVRKVPVPQPHEMQRDYFDPSLSWTSVAYVVVAAILGWFAKSGYKWTMLWLQRKAPQASIKESLARAQKTEAEARSIDVQANLSAATSVMSMVERMLAAQTIIDKLRDELAQREVELRLNEMQIKRLHGLLDAHGISYSDADRPRN